MTWPLVFQKDCRPPLEVYRLCPVDDSITDEGIVLDCGATPIFRMDKGHSFGDINVTRLSFFVGLCFAP